MSDWEITANKDIWVEYREDGSMTITTTDYDPVLILACIVVVLIILMIIGDLEFEAQERELIQATKRLYRVLRKEQERKRKKMKGKSVKSGGKMREITLDMTEKAWNNIAAREPEKKRSGNCIVQVA
jgi:predicted Holliday junction resolvase-like endonuclease